MEEMNTYSHLQSPAKQEIKLSDININKDEIFRAIGNGGPAMDKYVKDLTDELLSKCLTLATPMGSYSFYKNPSFDLSKGTLDLEDIRFNTGKIVASSLRKSSFIAVFICTAGDGIENYAKKLMGEGSSLEGFITDIIASVIAEEIANYIHSQIEKTAYRIGLKVTNRYSPGYCNWPVSDQQKLFKMMGNNSAGVKLTASSLMLPIKSVSGIVGLGTVVKKNAYKCNLCADEKCILRKIS